MMISIEELEFLKRLKGDYSNAEQTIKLTIHSVGYGIVIELFENGKSLFACVTGVKGNQIESYILVGLPNITQAIGKITDKNSLSFMAVESPLNIVFTNNLVHLTLTILFDNKNMTSYQFYKTC